MVLNWYLQNCKGKRVLDYCCGNGEDSIFIAKNGAKEVVGIDISPVSIENCRQRAIEEGVQDIASFFVMDAEKLEFEDRCFDVATEYGALHHLDLELAYGEMQRVLKTDGSAICTEALGHNPFIHVYRKMTPHLRTEWEARHILRKKQLKRAYRYFHEISEHFFHLATLGAVPFRNSAGFETLLGFLERIDNAAVRVPFLKWQAWQVVFIMSRPKF